MSTEEFKPEPGNDVPQFRPPAYRVFEVLRLAPDGTTLSDTITAHNMHYDKDTVAFSDIVNDPVLGLTQRIHRVLYGTATPILGIMEVVRNSSGLLH